ncbi:hypothetical protein PTNB85_00027 [Pyrenophora teres f. teres]|nr:hypothetical protein PTNB85_00027 [Pyrenophora teres f. teres]KAE8852362.1 hypothetical protein HRS9122_02649 [Pyrenophora teres f. teres]
MENNTWPRQAESTNIKSLNHLPSEILLLIFSYVDLHREARILGYIPDDPPPTPVDHYLIEDFRKCSVRNLALTCKKFAHLAQEVLLYAPVLDATFPHTLVEFESCGVVRFVRKLSQNPELSRYIKQLRICWSERIDGEPHSPDVDSSMSVSPAVLIDLESQMSRLEAPLNLPRLSQRSGSVTPFSNLVERSVPVLLSLLPHLETLCISDPYLTGPTHWSRTRMKSGHALSYLKVERHMMIVPHGLLECPKLQTLDLSLKIQGREASEILEESEMFRGVGIPNRPSHNIQHIRLDFEVKTMGIWNTTSRAYMNNIIHAFSDLESLTYYAESSASKNPYRSVRAFPAYQANIQYYPDSMSSFTNELTVDEQPWDRAIYDARTEVTDYQYLVDNLEHLRTSLQLLQLPGGFWTLPGAVQKPLPRFTQFSQLKRLIVPQAALISIKLDNMRFDAVFMGDFELSPAQSLPPCLVELTVFDADASFPSSAWLTGLFEDRKKMNMWPAFQKLKMLFGATFSEQELRSLLKRRSGSYFWNMVDEAQFEVEVWRDEEECGETFLFQRALDYGSRVSVPLGLARQLRKALPPVNDPGLEPRAFTLLEPIIKQQRSGTETRRPHVMDMQMQRSALEGCQKKWLRCRPQLPVQHHEALTSPRRGKLWAAVSFGLLFNVPQKLQIVIVERTDYGCVTAVNCKGMHNAADGESQGGCKIQADV